MPDITGMENQPDSEALEETGDAVDSQKFTGRRCMSIGNDSDRDWDRNFESFRHNRDLSRPRSAAPHASSILVALARIAVPERERASMLW